VTRFLEIICGKRSEFAVRATRGGDGENMGKEPSLLRRTFEASSRTGLCMPCYEKPSSSWRTVTPNIDDVDRSLRNDLGILDNLCWSLPIHGSDRHSGIRSRDEDLFPELSCDIRCQR